MTSPPPSPCSHRSLPVLLLCAWAAGSLPAHSALQAKYFAGRAFDTLLLERTDPNINFNWAEDSPDPLIPVNEFSARWTGFLTAPHSETYTLYIVSDNGSRLKLNGEVISENFNSAVGTEAGWSIKEVPFTAGERVTFELEYYESTGGAEMQLYWSSASQLFEIIPASAFSLPDPPPTGWTGRYFDGRQFEKAVLTRTESAVDFEWNGAPAPGLFADNFSAKWSGLLTPAFSETYTFTIAADNGTRLWIDGNLVSSAWDVAGGEDGGWRNIEVPLEAGKPVPILLDYYQAYGSASAALFWSSPSQPWEIVPTHALTALPTATPPWIGALPRRTSPSGTAVSVPVEASDASGPILEYRATGLPPGISLVTLTHPDLNPRGLPPLATVSLSGTPWLPGVYHVQTAATSAAGSARSGFSWTISGAGIDPGMETAIAHLHSTLTIARHPAPDRLVVTSLVPEIIAKSYHVIFESSTDLLTWENRTAAVNFYGVATALNDPKRESALYYQEPIDPAGPARRYFRIRLTARP